ncbi:MAG: hypothetical protein ABI134_35035 [Byssovorax sp.]
MSPSPSSSTWLMQSSTEPDDVLPEAELDEDPELVDDAELVDEAELVDDEALAVDEAVAPLVIPPAPPEPDDPVEIPLPAEDRVGSN